MIRVIAHVLIITILTIISQLGGIAWLLAMRFKRKGVVFLIAYCSLSISAMWVAPVFGREPLPCVSDDGLRMQSALYCALNRQYVVPELKEALRDLHNEIERNHPGTLTLILDANFPFLDGFPLLPHLSHDDGQKADIAFYYKGLAGYRAGETKSPIGYFAFEQGPTKCPDKTLSLRWDLEWLQPSWPKLSLEPLRMRRALRALNADPRVGKIFLEPHLQRSLGVSGAKIRFQGCRAARHDDHFHVQLR